MAHELYDGVPSVTPETRPTDAEGDRPPLLVPATPEAAIQFALGAIDAVCVVCATLIGRGLVAADAFQADAAERKALWDRERNVARAAAAELFSRRLRVIEQAKLKSNADLVVPESRTMN
jgi:hypothetical protein